MAKKLIITNEQVWEITKIVDDHKRRLQHAEIENEKISAAERRAIKHAVEKFNSLPDWFKEQHARNGNIQLNLEKEITRYKNTIVTPKTKVPYQGLLFFQIKDAVKRGDFATYEELINHFKNKQY